MRKSNNSFSGSKSGRGKRGFASKKNGKSFTKSKRNASFGDAERGGREEKSFKFKGGKSRRPSGGGGRGKAKGGNGKKRGNFIPVEKFIHKGRPIQEVKYEATQRYNEMPIHPKLLKNILNMGFTMPTEIQEKAFMPISEIKDVLGVANTGTGKTAAYLIPIINAMLMSETRFFGLVMVPTRELAEQVEDEFRKLSKGLKLFGTSFIGGRSISNDLRKLRKDFDIVIGTPGRLVDLSKRNALKFENFSVLILDEFDRMLDMGFSQDVNFITQKMTNRDQTLLFSATVDQAQKEIVDNILDNPVEIKVSQGNATAEHIDQDVMYYKRRDKFDVLLSLLEEEGFEKVMIFAETKRAVSELSDKLKKAKIKSDEIHGDKTQSYRKIALKDFKSGKIKVLVGTDVAARGLDISDVTHVINYQVPQDYETYIHRIGRTGRAGKKGKAYTFVEKK
ncbi:DEAD/DEAH box helicase [Ornithobacterium rhinotracheale]|uniref:DEAD/DEAH box helicase n=1 Tax=Ornithobacterium rhinotracheale TaxID=28251 RepID=UPI001FF38183|nr:DEAD/DEAH box helicase [Ornithobacterium rhinotracheale]MCK0202250.1 DEAD/DEAH box helicase [Ornithobacterium rhinotracheale]